MKKFTDDPGYYRQAAKGSVDTGHPGMRLLKTLIKKDYRVLDLGCGEGSRLNFLVNNSSGYGIDISKNAVTKANKKYPNLKITQSNLYKLPFKENSFHLVYSAFVIEHLEHPEIMINEARRVLIKGGIFVIIAPNYGAPNRCSPNFSGSRGRKFVIGLKNDIYALFVKSEKLNWNKVMPDEGKKYFQDADTVIEPYLGSLVKYLKILGFKVTYTNSCWGEELPSVKLHQKLFRFFSLFRIYPLTYWGPHLVISATYS